MEDKYKFYSMHYTIHLEDFSKVSRSLHYKYSPENPEKPCLAEFEKGDK